MPDAQRSVRESRRLAALARDIVADHTGPWKTIEGWTRTHPEVMVVLAFLVGVTAGRCVRIGPR